MDNMPATLKYIFTKSHPQAQSTTILTSYETHKSRTEIKKGRNVPVGIDQKRRRWGERGSGRRSGDGTPGDEFALSLAVSAKSSRDSHSSQFSSRISTLALFSSTYPPIFCFATWSWTISSCVVTSRSCVRSGDDSNH
jgi:hypothetical protein